MKIHGKGELRVSQRVGKQGRQSETVADGEVEVDHGRVGVHVDLAHTHLKGKLVVHGNFMTVLKKGENVLVFVLIESLELGKLERARVHMVKVVDGGRVGKSVAYDLFENFRLRSDGVIRVHSKSVRNVCNVCRGFDRDMLCHFCGTKVKAAAKTTFGG